MTFRDLALDAIRMKNAERSPFEIHRHIVSGAVALGLYTEEGDENSFTIRQVKTGAKIRFDGKDYSYSPR